MKRSIIFILPMEIQRFNVENLQKYSRSEKLPQQIFLKKIKTFAASMNYFMKYLSNEIALASNKKLNMLCQICCASNIYSNRPMLKEEAKVIKERLQWCSLDGFSASDGWLDGWETA